MELSAGVALTMDFGPDKTDAQILLDYGVVDDDNPQVSGCPFAQICMYMLGQVHGTAAQ